LRALASILRKEFPKAKIIILTAYASDVQGAMKLGAREAYLLKTQLDKEVLATIRMVYSGIKRFSTPSRLQPDPQSDRASQIAPGLRANRK
jgi:DNA-binding NarL/FixJ family response regulator